MAWNKQTSKNDDSINAQRSVSLAMNLHSFMLWFPYCLETLCIGNSLYFDKYAHTSVLQADSHINAVKYRQVGRSALQLKCHSYLNAVKYRQVGRSALQPKCHSYSKVWMLLDLPIVYLKTSVQASKTYLISSSCCLRIRSWLRNSSIRLSSSCWRSKSETCNNRTNQ